MVAVEVFVTIVALAVVGLLLLAGAAALLGKRFHLDEWFRRDRQRLELYRQHERDAEEARAAALKELAPSEETDQQIVQQRHQEEK
jgi:hypothetical protein